MSLPALATERLSLRSYAAGDLDELLPIWRDPDVRRYLFDDKEVSRETAESIVAKCMAEADAGLGLWKIRVAESTVGCAGLYRVGNVADYAPELVGEVELLIALAPRAWGEGYGAETVGAVLAHGFDTLGLGRIVAANDVPNEASDRLLRRVGFRVLGECEGPAYRMRTYEIARGCGR